MKKSHLQLIFRILLGAFLIFTGVNHLTFARVEFLTQVPPWVPLDGNLVVVLSGIAEIALGLGLVLLSRQQRAGGPGYGGILCDHLPR